MIALQRCALVGCLALAACGGEVSVQIADGSADVDATTDAELDAGADTDGDDGAVIADAMTFDVSRGACAACSDGCCQGTTCVPLSAQTASACGFGAETCIACGPGGSCHKGVCVFSQPSCGPSNCSGCCSDSTHCTTGLSDIGCGFGGQNCQNCRPTNNLCIPHAGGGGACGGIQTCSPRNCLGCCQGNVCVAGQDVSSCGTMGQACASCATGESCVSQGPGAGGTCQSPPFCTAQSCATCCKGNQCMPGDTNSVCGEQSNVCADCTAQGKVCVNHQCTTGCSPASCARLLPRELLRLGEPGFRLRHRRRRVRRLLGLPRALLRRRSLRVLIHRARSPIPRDCHSERSGISRIETPHFLTF